MRSGHGCGTASHGTPEPTNTSSTGLKITILLFSLLRGGLPPPLDNSQALEPVSNVSGSVYNPPPTPQQVETHSRDGPLPQNEPLPSTPTQEGEEEIVIAPPPPPTKEAVRRAIEEVVGGRFDKDEDEEVSLEHLHALNNSRKRGWGDVPNEILNEGEEEVGENDDEEGVKIIEKPRPSKKARKQARGDQPPASLETSVEPSESEYPFPS
jgi:hypothetical protein